MTPLDYWNFLLFIQKGQTRSHVIDNKSENAEPLRHTEINIVWSRLSGNVRKHHSVVGLKHNELKLDIVCDKRSPNSLSFLLEINLEFYVWFKIIVLGVLLSSLGAFFHVSKSSRTEHTRLLKGPINKLLAKLLIIRRRNEQRVRAHFNTPAKHCSMIVQTLIARH